MTAQVQPSAQSATFALERFAWDSPDRLEVSGWVHRFEEAPQQPPVLVVESNETTHRLAAAERQSGPAGNGDRWWAAFAWSDAPAAFERAWLELGGELIVELPEPDDGRTGRGARMLAVRRRTGGSEPGGQGAGGRLALQADLLLAQEEVLSLRAAVEHLQEELQRARADVDAERDRRAADSERFRGGLERVRTSAEEALSAERGKHDRLGRELDDTRRELQDHRVRLGALEQVATAASRQRSGIEAARTEAEQLLTRLTRLCDTSMQENET